MRQIAADFAISHSKWHRLSNSRTASSRWEVNINIKLLWYGFSVFPRGAGEVRATQGKFPGDSLRGLYKFYGRATPRVATAARTTSVCLVDLHRRVLEITQSLLFSKGVSTYVKVYKIYMLWRFYTLYPICFGVPLSNLHWVSLVLEAILDSSYHTIKKKLEN